MGKVLTNFMNGYPGAISRSLDDVVIAMANVSGSPLAFGQAVALSMDRTGVVPFDGSSHTAADFVGVTVRNPSKTPETYGSNLGSYASGEMADVLVRGHIAVRVASASAKAGDQAAIQKTTGAFTVGSGDTVVQLPTVHITAAPDAAGMGEIVLNTRNLV